MFAFDRVFDDNTNQADVYEGTTKCLLDNVLDGYNATVFAYGATGCGKTHTITGTSQHPGIIFMTMQELFEKIEDRKADKTTELTLSYLEIYNETIRDLLVPAGSGPKGGLMLREDSNQAVAVPGLTSHRPKDVKEVMDMIILGNEYRTVSPTEANATSSRSHAVLQINVTQKDRNADVNEPHTMATLSIIDLAGSERASVTKNRGERLTEGANINKSLLALGGCINALCDRRQKQHVPYRNSKLTRLLKFSLGGNCKTVMIVCISPSSAHYDETQNTLRYANRAKNIQTKVTRNVFNVNRHVKDFLVKIDEQMALINELKAQQKDAEKLSFAKFQKQCQKRDAVAREGIQRLQAAYEHASGERQERVNSMKRLRGFERRIGLLSGWVAAFDTVCDQRGDEEDSMPKSLTAVRKTARGILVELENSRHHMHQKLEKLSWERAIDTALSHSLKQLEVIDGADTGEADSLSREAELLKANFNREAVREVLDQDKGGDAAMVQMLLTSQFEMLASLSDMMGMNEEDAVAHARETISSLLQAGFTTASQVVKPSDGALPMMEAFSPTRKGTPKRKKNALSYVKPLAVPALTAVQNEHVFTSPMKSFDGSMKSVAGQMKTFASPMKSSPRRRKAPLSATKKGISFTPVKKMMKSTRGVRWRDDETELGTLADFEKTPKKMGLSPEVIEAPKNTQSENLEPVVEEEREDFSQLLPRLREIEPMFTVNEESSPSLEVPEVTTILPASKPSRFQAGFLSKAPRGSDGSPLQIPSLSLNLASDSPESESKRPLQSLDVTKTGNLSPPSATRPKSSRPSRLTPPRISSLQMIMDENQPPQHSISSASGSDSESSSIDPKKLRSAMSSFQKDRARRVSLMTGTAASNAKRNPSMGGLSGAGNNTLGDSSFSLSAGTSSASRGHMSRASISGGVSSLASSTNGISRHHRRGSAAAERRRSPPLACSPPWGVEGKLGGERAFTAGQARRMNLGGSVNVAASGGGGEGVVGESPKEGGIRRATMGGIGFSGGHRRQESRGSMALR